MGVPAIYLAATGRGYTDEQQKKYRLVYNLKDFGWEGIQRVLVEIMSTDPAVWKRRQARLLAETVEVATFAAELVMGFSDSVALFRQRFDPRGHS